MNHFDYVNGELTVEGLRLSALADAVGTPFFCYSSATLERHYRVYEAAFAGLDAKICFALKANSNQSVIKTLARLGAGADVVSGGELERALAAGITGDKIVFSGVGKSRAEMARAIEADIHQINVESLPELETLSGVAANMGKTARIALRVNPHIDANTHAKITTGKAENKFGIDWTRAKEVYVRAAALPGIEVTGIAMHIGSQLTDLAPYRAAFLRLRDLVCDLKQIGIAVKVLDIGGGLGIPYDKEQPPLPADYGALVKELLGDLGCSFTCEPGRLIAGNAGILVTGVICEKQGEARRFVIVDAAMNDLIRPTLYDSYHGIIPVRQPAPDDILTPADVVGPVCETGDGFGTDRPLPACAPGDLIAILSAGAYGAVMSSTYNTRPLCPEVLVKGESYAVIRPRQSVEELIAGDKIAAWLE